MRGTVQAARIERVNYRNGYRQRRQAPAPGRLSWRSRSCWRARISRSDCWRAPISRSDCWSAAAAPSRRWFSAVATSYLLGCRHTENVGQDRHSPAAVPYGPREPPAAPCRSSAWPYMFAGELDRGAPEAR